MKIKGNKFLIIGGAGLIGSHLAEEILKYNPLKIYIFDNFCRGNIKNLKKIKKDKRVIILDKSHDILKKDSLDKIIRKVDGVFHLAALWLLECYENPRKAFQVNIEGTFNVIESCAKHNIKKLIFSSSASVYGDAITKKISEDHPFNNQNFYGASKICGEAMLKAMHYRYNLNYLGLRYMNVYGPRQDYKGAYIAVIMKMINAIKSGNSPTIFGNGKESFDFVNVIDCARANICAMQSNKTNRFYNVGTGIKTSLNKLAEILLDLLNSQKKIRYLKNNKVGLVKNRVANINKAKKEINFFHTVNLKEGLRNLIDWMS